MNEVYCNKSVLQAGKILDAIAAAREPISLTEIVRYTGLKQDAVFRLLVTMEGMGWLNRVAEKKFELGMGLALLWARKRSRLESQQQRIEADLEALETEGDNGE